MVGSETNEIIEKPFESLSQNYQKGLEEPMRGSMFVRGSIDLERGGPYIDSPEWLKNKKTVINPKNNGDNCFQCSLTVALNHKPV